jgi:hypothetical protein
MESGIYKHYKGGYYQVLGIGQHSETDELMVVYVSLDAGQLGPRLRVRPLNGVGGWNEPVRHSQVGGTSVIVTPRFEYVGDSI